jgi:hypothetical protein
MFPTLTYLLGLVSHLLLHILPSNLLSKNVFARGTQGAWIEDDLPVA